MTRPRCAIWRSVHRGRGYGLGQLVLYVVAWQDAVLAGIVSAPGVLREQSGNPPYPDNAEQECGPENASGQPVESGLCVP
jgi:hypothetical protein